MSGGHVVPPSPEVRDQMAELRRIAPGERMLPVVQHGMLQQMNGLARFLWRAFSSVRGPFARMRWGSGSRAMNAS
jgi:hypothetical protein